MDILSDINYIAVLVAAVSAFAVGGVWYGPLFGKAWMQAFNISEADIAQANMVKVYGLAFLLSLFAAAALDVFFIHDGDGYLMGLHNGFVAGLCWVAAFTGIQYLFEGRSLKAFLINGGYSTLALSVMGVIIGAIG